MRKVLFLIFAIFIAGLLFYFFKTDFRILKLLKRSHKQSVVYLSNNCAKDQGCIGSELRLVETFSKDKSVLATFPGETELITLISPDRKKIIVEDKKMEQLYLYDFSKKMGSYLGKSTSIFSISECAWYENSDGLLCKGREEKGVRPIFSVSLKGDINEVYSITRDAKDLAGLQVLGERKNKLIYHLKTVNKFEVFTYDLGNGKVEKIFSKEMLLVPFESYTSGKLFIDSLDGKTLDEIDIDSRKAKEIYRTDRPFIFLPSDDGSSVYIFIPITDDDYNSPIDIYLVKDGSAKKIAEFKEKMTPADVTTAGEIVFMENFLNLDSVERSGKIAVFNPANNSLNYITDDIKNGSQFVVKVINTD